MVRPALGGTESSFFWAPGAIVGCQSSAPASMQTIAEYVAVEKEEKFSGE